VDCSRLRREGEIERAAAEREKARLLAEAEATISALQDEKERILVQAHQDLRNKVSEMNEKMQKSLQQIKESDADKVRHELEGHRIRGLAEMQKECQREIEKVRTEERRIAAMEIENVRHAFRNREHQTSEDLIQLEKLHGVRVKQLEQQVATLKAQSSAQREQLQEASKVANTGSAQVQRSVQEMKARMEEQAQRADELHAALQAVHQELQEGKVRESSYRDQLSRALTQNRLQHAELLEARQQACQGTATAAQWRNVTRESDITIAAAETSVRIAREEIAMLEQHLHRVETENIELKSELQRADRLVYGVVHSSSNVHNAQNSLGAQHANMRSSMSSSIGGGAYLNSSSNNALNLSTLSTKHLLRASKSAHGSFSVPPSDLLVAHTMSSSARYLAQNSMAVPKASAAKNKRVLTPKR
jgi:DNA repair exonuclease SbcCD ATPase subunit